ncbi:MAG: hypothetical protein WBD16_04020 [Pyrinomonadaceae bacterium]
MIDYKKIAIISVRILGISFIFSGILELFIIVTALLLVTRGTIPPEMVAQETWFVQSVVWIIGGTFLYVRSKSLGVVIVESLFGKDDELEPTDEVK